MSKDFDPDREQPIYIDVKAMLSGPYKRSIGIVMDILTVVWWPTKAAFVWDANAIAAALTKANPGRPHSAAVLRRHKRAILEYFSETSDGRLAPSPKYFSMVDSYPGRLS